MSLLPESVQPLLPYLIPVALMAYILIVAFGGTIRRRRRQAKAARRKADPRQPWHRWMDEINRKVGEEKKPGAIEKWRE